MQFKFTFLRHFGAFFILPSLELHIIQCEPTLIFRWLLFRFDIISYKTLPSWFMKYIWGFINLDFIFNKNED